MILELCQDYFLSKGGYSDLKKGILEPIGSIVYNELYFYVWFICLYHVFLLIIVVANLILLLRLLQFTTLYYTNNAITIL
jgi:hypothetical protein